MAAETDVTAAVRHLQPAWSADAVAQAVGIAALEEEAHTSLGR